MSYLPPADNPLCEHIDLLDLFYDPSPYEMLFSKKPASTQQLHDMEVIDCPLPHATQLILQHNSNMIAWGQNSFVTILLNNEIIYEGERFLFRNPEAERKWEAILTENKPIPITVLTPPAYLQLKLLIDLSIRCREWGHGEAYQSLLKSYISKIAALDTDEVPNTTLLLDEEHLITWNFQPVRIC